MADERLTASERKRRKLNRDAERRKSLVNLKSAVDQWMELRARLSLDNDELAVTLMEYYEGHRNCLRLNTSTPGKSRPRSGSVDSSTGRSISSMSGIDPIVTSTDSETETVHSGSEGQSSTVPRGEDTTLLFGYDSLSDGEVIECFADSKDLTWEPSIGQIPMSDTSYIHEDNPEEFLEDQVFDTNFDGPDDLEPEEDETPPKQKDGCLHFIKVTDPKEAASSDKCVAFTSCLLQLANNKVPNTCHRKGCNSTIGITTVKRGTAIQMNWVCEKGHNISKWSSQPKLPKGHQAGDLALSASILLSGNNYKKVMMLFKFLKLGSVNKSTFFQLQSLYCCPVIDRFWGRILASNKKQYAGQEVVIAGDGRMDSPGFCAKYCTYTVMHHDTLEILSMQVVDKREVDLKSSTMEMKAFKGVMEEMKKDKIVVTEVVTDAHPSISAYMRKNQPSMKHSYDVWHGAKNMAKKLTSIASVKATKELVPWRSDIINHFWSSCQTAEGDEMLLRNKWTGVVHHIVDQHEWALGECAHGEIDQEKEYLTSGSTAHQALIEFVFDDRLMKNLTYYINYRSTAELEGFQNHILMYAGKRYAYTYPVYKARCQLAAIDYEMHRGRSQLLNKDGSQRWKRMFNKNSVRWRAVPVKEDKHYVYIEELMTEIFKEKMEDTGSISRHVEISKEDPANLSKTIAPVPPPCTSKLVEERVTRFGKPKKE